VPAPAGAASTTVMMRLVVVSGLSGRARASRSTCSRTSAGTASTTSPPACCRRWSPTRSRTRSPCTGASRSDRRAQRPGTCSHPQLLADLRRSAIRCEEIYLHAEDETCCGASPRRAAHPLAGERTGLAEAIAAERTLLHRWPIRPTWWWTLGDERHQLREVVRQRVESAATAGCRSCSSPSATERHPGRRRFRLRHPHAAQSLLGTGPEAADRQGRSRPRVPGREPGGGPPVRRHRPLRGSADTEYERHNRGYLTVAIGCTGGQHRSVYLVEKLAAYFSARHRRC